MDKHTIFYDAECPICIREIALILEDNRANISKPSPFRATKKY